MTKISASMTFHKRFFPLIWFGFTAASLGVGVIPVFGEGIGPEHLPFLMMPILMAVIGYVVMRRLIWDLVDEVYDYGDYLLVRNNGDEARIELSEIMNVSASTHVNPPRITLRLTRETRFGREISFSPIHRFTLNRLAKNEIAERLIERVYDARPKR